ncbi:hypothetical protein [Polaribacter aestuariivivens]|uniref:hypothetical protein n=1 Tax=Polaribacter aestuariivivens TaxID=2304626 RepID=UPI003F493475
MKKVIILNFILVIILNACTIDEIISENVNFKFNLENYTDIDYQNTNLIIGAKDKNGNFIALETITYPNILSNISPSNDYLTGDELPFFKPSTNGYFYYRINKEQFVEIPFPLTTTGTINIDENEILEISDYVTFKIEFANGNFAFIEDFNLKEALDNSEELIHLIVKIEIKNNGVSGNVSVRPY